MAAVLEVTDAAFEQEVLNSDMPVLVDFWAPGCPPCVALAPVLDKLAGEMPGKVKFVKVNAAQEQRTASKYHLQAVPSLFIFTGGQVASSLIGLQPEREIRRALTAALGEA